MQTAPKRAGGLALRQGLIFGLILGIVLIILSLLSLVVSLGIASTTISVLLYLVASAFAGFRISQQTGRIGTGVLVGLFTGLFASIITSIYSLIYTLINIDTIRNNAQKISPTVHFTNSLLLTGFAIGIGFLIILAILLGMAGGAIGGAIGRSRVHLPVQTHEDSMFEPPPPPTIG